MTTRVYKVSDFCDRVTNNIHALIDDLSQISRHVSQEEKIAWKQSFPEVASVLSMAMAQNKGLADAHVALEYKLPSVSFWCDLVLIGRNKENEKQAIILELKNWQENSKDTPGCFEGLMIRHGASQQHPADQVKGYIEFCRHFHSVVLEQNVNVDGCVFFTQRINLEPYKSAPNDKLTGEYLLFDTMLKGDLCHFICDRLSVGDEEFAKTFVKGYYKQDKKILLQVARNFAESTAKPFVLLGKQREGYAEVQHKLSETVTSRRKQVIIVQGLPGSGKSAMAVNLWFDAVRQYHACNKPDSENNVLYVTTSSSQNDNWAHIFKEHGKRYNADKLIIKANAFNPGLNGAKVKERYQNEFERLDSRYIVHRSDNSKELNRMYWKDYTDYLEKTVGITYKPDQHFLSIVDEAHALIDPSSPRFQGNKIAGWCYQMGPQAYHIMKASCISVFFIDGDQSFRDNESTSLEDLVNIAKMVNATVHFISLEGIQFRCGGSKEYVDWVESVLQGKEIDNVSQWIEEIPMTVFDYPSDMEHALRNKISQTTMDARIVSSYSRKWISKNIPDMHAVFPESCDFVLPDRENRTFYKYWNDHTSYTNYILGRGDAMQGDPLSEVGCPYVVRGFDYEYIGVLWLEDLVWRNGKWMLDLNYIEETAIASTKKSVKSKIGKKRSLIALTPDSEALFRRVTGTYRILLTRATKGNFLYIKDKETREHIKQLIGQK